ncbi:hypothetical protein HK096_011077 [Nowakowskiella sp. JEL0078]|nr:hypothetical protein HK096_011077 [Nowakowskiella sp. JEL0078]
MSLSANGSSTNQAIYPLLSSPKRSTNPILKLDLLRRSPSRSTPKLSSPGLDFSILSAPWQKSKSESKSKSVIKSNRNNENVIKDTEFESPKLIKNHSNPSHQESNGGLSYPPSPNRMFSSTSSSTTIISSDFVHPPPATERSFTKFSARSDLSSAGTFTSQKGKSPEMSNSNLENYENLEEVDDISLDISSGIIPVNDSIPRRKRANERVSVISTLSRIEERQNNSASLPSPNLISVDIDESLDMNNRRFSRRSMDFAHKMISPIEDMTWFKRNNTRSSEDNSELPKEPEVKKWNKLASFIKKGTLKLRTSSGPRSGSSHGSYLDSPVEANNPHTYAIFKQRSVDRRQTAPPGSLVLDESTNISDANYRPKIRQSSFMDNVNNRLSVDFERSVSLESPVRKSISFRKPFNFVRSTNPKLDVDENVIQRGASFDGISGPIQTRLSISAPRSPLEKMHTIKEFARSSFDSIRPKFNREMVETATQTSFELSEEVDIIEKTSISQIDIKASTTINGKFSKSMVTKRSKTGSLRSARKLPRRNSTDSTYSIKRGLITSSLDSLHNIYEENQESMSSEFKNSPGIISRNLDLPYMNDPPILEEFKEKDTKKNILVDINIENDNSLSKKLEETQKSNLQQQSQPHEVENIHVAKVSKIVTQNNVMNVLRRLRRTKKLVSGSSIVSQKDSQISLVSDSSSSRIPSNSSLKSLANFNIKSRFSSIKLSKQSNDTTLTQKLSIESLSKRQTQDVIEAVLLVVNKPDEQMDIGDLKNVNGVMVQSTLETETTDEIDHLAIKDIEPRSLSLPDFHHLENKSLVLEKEKSEVTGLLEAETRNVEITDPTKNLSSESSFESEENLTHLLQGIPPVYFESMPKPMARRESLADRAGTWMPQILEDTELFSESEIVSNKSTSGLSSSLSVDTIKGSNIELFPKASDNLSTSHEIYRSGNDGLPVIGSENSPVITEAGDVYYTAASEFGMEERRSSILSNSSSPTNIETETTLNLSNQKEKRILIFMKSDESGDESLDIELNEEDFSTSKFIRNLENEKTSVIQKIFTDLESMAQNLDIPSPRSIAKSPELIQLDTNDGLLDTQQIEEIEYAVEISTKVLEKKIEISNQDYDIQVENETPKCARIPNNVNSQINDVIYEVQEREVKTGTSELDDESNSQTKVQPECNDVSHEIIDSESEERQEIIFEIRKQPGLVILEREDEKSNSEVTALDLDSNLKISDEKDSILEEKKILKEHERTDEKIEIMFESKDQEIIGQNSSEFVSYVKKVSVEDSNLDIQWNDSASKLIQAKERSLPVIVVERQRSDSSQLASTSLETPHVPETPHPHAVPGFIFPSPTPILSCDEDDDTNFPEVYYTNGDVESPQVTPRNAYEDVVSEEYVLLKTKLQSKTFPKEKFHLINLLNMDLSDDESDDTPYNFSFPSSSIIPPLPESFGRRRSSRLRTFSQKTNVDRSDSIDSTPTSVKRRWSAPNFEDEENADYQIELKSIRRIRSKTDSIPVMQDKTKLESENEVILEKKSEIIEKTSVVNVSPLLSETNVSVLSDPDVSIANFTSFQEFAKTCKTPTNAESIVESDYFNSNVSTWHPLVTVEGNWGDMTDSVPSPIYSSPSVTSILLPLVTPKVSDTSFVTESKFSEKNQNSISRYENNHELTKKPIGKQNMETKNETVHKYQVRKNVEIKKNDEEIHQHSQVDGQRQKRNRRKKTNKKGISEQSDFTAEVDLCINKNTSSSIVVPVNALPSPIVVENKKPAKKSKEQSNQQVNRVKVKAVQPQVNVSIQAKGKQQSIPVHVFVTPPEEDKIIKKNTDVPKELSPIAPLSAAAALSYFDSDKVGNIAVAPKWQPRIFSKGSPFGGDENWRYEDSIEQTQPQFIQHQYHYQHQNQLQFVPEYYPQQHYIPNAQYGQTASGHSGRRYGKTPKN